MQPQRPQPFDYDRLDDAELARRAAGREAAAFQAIMRRFNQRLYRVARAVVRDEAEAEDVVQEAYLRAFTHIGGFRAEAGLGTWLTTITLNEARERLRRRRRLVDVAAIEQAQTSRAEVIMFPTPASPEVDAARSQLRRLIEEAVDELPTPFRLVFLLREVEDCSTEEVALQLGLKPETVKTRLHRARRLLRKALDEKLSASLAGAFPFLGARCERITSAVLARLRCAGLADESA